MPTITDIYEVQPGDSLSRIANQFGVSMQDLLNANQQILINPFYSLAFATWVIAQNVDILTRSLRIRDPRQDNPQLRQTGTHAFANGERHAGATPRAG